MECRLEDLGLFANSTPLVVGGQSGRFATGQNGELNYASWVASTDIDWEDVS
jgi:hypothetical protein